jgi:choline monooxygenase
MHVSFATKPLTRGGTPLDPGYLDDIPGLPAFNKDMALFHALFPNVFYFALPSHVFTVYCNPTGMYVNAQHKPKAWCWALGKRSFRLQRGI